MAEEIVFSMAEGIGHCDEESNHYNEESDHYDEESDEGSDYYDDEIDQEIDHYKVLRLPSGEEGAQLTLDQIEMAYKWRSKPLHPDNHPDNPYATADLQQIRSSYDFLLDGASRRAFDARLRARKEKDNDKRESGDKRRQMVGDLEERERAAKRRKPDSEEVKRRKEKIASRELARELHEFLMRSEVSMTRNFYKGSAFL